jgi:glycerol-3-phosphate acyltransferase PlsY
MSFEQDMIFLGFPLMGYLLGSVPFAWVIGKAHGVDIRTVGSRNIGATNLGRTLGKKYFWQAFLLDAAKGFFPVLAASLIERHWNAMSPAERPFWQPLPMWAPLLTAVACVLGHLFPIWLKFKGGKGVATGFGAVLGFWPLYTIAGLLAGALFVLMLLAYRYISLASMTSSVGFVVFVAMLGSYPNRWVETYLPFPQLLPLLVVASLFALLIVVRHRANITRLIHGTEPKVGQREIDKARMDRK